MKTRVLIADDHKILRQSLFILLQQEDDIDVVGEAGTGSDALEAVQRLKPDVAILDISLPQLSGLDVAAHLRQVAPDVHVIILTMHKGEDFVARAFRQRVQGYVLKDNALEELLQAIRVVRAGGTYVSPDIAGHVVAGFVENYSLGRERDILSPREREIVELLASGQNNRDIADLLRLSLKTVETHRANIMRKLGLRGMRDLVLYAVRNHIIEP